MNGNEVDLNEQLMDTWTTMSEPTKNLQWPDEMTMNGASGSYDAIRMGFGPKDSLRK